MAKFTALIRWAIVSGPMVVKMVRNYAPVIKKVIESNPEAVSKLTGKLKSYQGAKDKKGVPGLSARVHVLREQASYLYGSANTPEVAENAVAWKSQLAKIEAAIPLIEVMSPKEQKRQIKELNDKIDALSNEILAAVVEDDIQDAEILDDDQ
ncbi:MAG: hypothetical protein QMB98_02435 [Flaviflexus sp.]|uniref:hypothetical protein n=1 Tax=Flaviflexus sp. TaxID=1969482 RepID=UPI00352D390A